MSRDLNASEFDEQESDERRSDRQLSPTGEDATPETEVIDEPREILEYRAAIGLNADYYLQCWGLLGDAQPRGAGFNLGACVLSGLWLPFRKMFRVTLVYYFLVLGWAFFEELVVIRLWNMELPGWLFSLIRLTPPAVCGLLANRWYFQFIQRLVEAAQAEEPDQDARLMLLQQRGGVSLLAAGSMVLLFSIMVGIALMIIELLAPIPVAPIP